MKETVLLTGIGGSIGCHTFAHLMHNTEWDVVGIDSFRHKGLTDRVEHMFTEHPEWRQRLRMFTHDLTAPISQFLIDKIGPVDYIISMASLSDVHASIINPAPFVLSNVQVALTMLEYARIAKPKAFLQISTDEVYGPTDGEHLHREWDAIVPSNPYSASKAAQEAIAISYWRTYNVPLMIVNLMNNFGEMQSASKFPAMVQRKVRDDDLVIIHATEGQVGSRYYIHSRNSADAFLFLLKNNIPYMHAAGHPDKPDRFNIVGDKQISNLDLALMISDICGRPLDYQIENTAGSRPGHDIHYGLDGSKLTGAGWTSPQSLEDSMRATVEWYEEHPEWLDPH